MRIAAVLHDASSDHDGAPLLPTLALERDGAVYGVAALARALSVSMDFGFHEAVVALGGASLRELDERVRSGERPSSARLLPGTFTWLPPCETERAAYVICAEATAARRDVPTFRLGSARAFSGHEATVPCDVAGDDVAFDGGVAAVLGDDLFRATAVEADEAILGFTLVLEWAGGLGAQLGPALVTREEIRTIAGLRAQIRAGGAPLDACALDDGPFSPAEAIAWTSHRLPLHAGDVIRVACVRAAHAPRAALGTRVEVAVERLGRLSGKPCRGPEMRDWRHP